MKEIPGLEYLSWDSQFFKKKIGRVTVPLIRQLSEIREEAADSGYDCLFLETGFSDRETVESSLTGGGRLTDIKTTLGAEIGPGTPAPAAGSVTVRGDETMRSQAESIAADVLAPLSRYAVDPGFGPEESRRLYRCWAGNAGRGDFSRAVFYSASGDNNLEGFITLREKNNGLFIDLFAVAPPFRGRNIGSRLIGAAKNWCLDHGFNRLRVTTQGYNVAALRAYEKNGFRTEQVSLFFHLWL